MRIKQKIYVCLTVTLFMVAPASAETLCPGWWNASLGDLQAARNQISEVIGEPKTEWGTVVQGDTVILLDGWKEAQQDELKNALDQLEGQIVQMGGILPVTSTPVPTFTPMPSPTSTPFISSSTSSNSSSIAINPIIEKPEIWFKRDVQEIVSLLLEHYVPNTLNEGLGKKLGVLSFENSERQPYKVTLEIDVKDDVLNTVCFFFNKDKELYGSVTNSLLENFGKPSFTDSYTDGDIFYCATEDWRIKGYNLSIFNNNEYSFKAKEDGRAPFNLRIRRDGIDVKSDSTLQPLISTSPASIPVNVHVSIASVSLKKNSIGVPELYVCFKNNDTSDIDRIDFSVKCYDAYGKQIKGYGYYDINECFYDDVIIKSNKTSSKDIYWIFYGFDGTASVEIAITKYHTTSGRSVEVPESQYKWIKYSF